MKNKTSAFIVLTAVFSFISIEAFGSGEIVGWGNNTYGQTGIPLVDNLYKAISAGYYHSLGLETDGSIVAYGRNDYGQCNVPAPNADFNAIAAGGRHSLGLKLDGSIVAWGHNGYGQCDVPSPNTGFIAIAAGYSHSLGLKADGSIVAWGRNDFGQCNVPLPNSGFIAVAAGNYHSLGLKWNGQIVAWGNNVYGQCDVPLPNSNFKAMDGGAYHSLALKQDGSVVAWGYNGQGQCTIPTPNSSFIAISAGAYHSMALKSNYSLVAWGYNASGQCSAPLPNPTLMAISAGGEHSLGICPFFTDVFEGQINYGVTYQQIDGFGGAGVYEPGTLMSRPYKKKVCDLLFRELGLDILRIRNTYDTDPGGYHGYGDWDFMGTAGVVAEAKQRNPSIKLELVPWSPPASLKSTESIDGGGTIARDEYGNCKYNEYARWWGDSLEAFAAVGVVPDYISIQNEPDIGTNYDSMMLMPVEDYYYAGYNKAFEAVYQELYSRMGPNMPKMFGPETSGFYYSAPSYINSLINQDHCYGFSIHAYDYGTSGYDNPDSMIDIMTSFANQYGYKPIHMTEFCRLNKTPDFADALNLGWHIHNFFKYMKVNAYYHWTLFRGWGSGGMINCTDPNNYIMRDLYWFLKAYSRFTDPGWYVVNSSTNISTLRITAFKNPAGNRLTVVILNVSGSGVKLSLNLNDFTPVISTVYRSDAYTHWQYCGTYNPMDVLLCPRQSITTISLWTGLTDCDAVLAAGYRLPADISGSGNCYVDFDDLYVLADNWLRQDCGSSNNCDGADFASADGAIDFVDFSNFATQWLNCNDPQNPNCTHNW